MIRTSLAAHSRLVVRRPGLAWLALALVTVAAAALLPSFRIDPDVGGMLPTDHPAARILRETRMGEESARTSFLVLRGDDLGERLPAIVETLRASPFLAEVAATTEELIGGGDELPGDVLAVLPEQTLAAIEERLGRDGRRAAIAESRELLAEDPFAGEELVLRDPLGLRWILEEARRSLAPPGLDLDSSYLWWPERGLALARLVGKEAAFDLEFSRGLLADLEARLDDVEWSALGGYEIAVRDAERIRGDMTSSLGWSIPLLILFLALSTRSLLVPHLYLAPVLVAVVWALGFGGALFGPLTPLAVGGAAILMGLGVDFAVHYVDRLREERARGVEGAVQRTHEGTGHALVLGMATTVAAFLSISFGSFPGLGGFGALLALGLVSAWLATITLTPLFGRLVGPGGQRGTPATGTGGRDEAKAAPVGPVLRWAGLLARSGWSRPFAGLLGVASLAGWVVAGGGGLIFDADPRHMRPEDVRFAQRVRELEGALGASPLGLRVLVPAGTERASVADGLEGLLAGGHVARVRGGEAFGPGRVRRERLGLFEERTAGWIEGAREDLADAGFRVAPFEEGLAETARMLSRAEPLDPAIGTGVEWDGRTWVELALHPPCTPEGRGEREALRGRVREALGDGVRIVDAAGLADELGPLLAGDLRRAMAICSLVVALLVLVALRGARDRLAALSPVLCGLGLVLGGLALSGFPLHPGNLIALPLVLGLGVDDGIHMVLRWREGQGDPLTTTGVAVWRTSVTTAIGFGSLATASSPAIASLGMLAGAGALICFVATVVVVPALLGSKAPT